MEFHRKESAPPIVLDLYDHDSDLLDFDGDDFLGRAVIKLEHASLVEQATKDSAQQL